VVRGKLVTLDLFDDPIEADYSRELLTRNGIEAVLTHQEGDVAGLSFQNLRVPEPEVDRAKEILQAFRARQTVPARSEAYRAARTAFIGIGFPPLQLYSMWLVARLVRRRSQLSDVDRRYLKIAALLDLWLPVVILAFAIVPHH
jgi:hypothetical protein